MRSILPVLLLLPGTAFADRFEAAARIEAVTLYGAGAQVSRKVSLSAPAGSHELLIPGLPQGMDPALLRVSAPEGVRVTSMRLSSGRQPLTKAAPRPEVQAAKDEVSRLEEIFRKKQQEVQLLWLRSEAAEAQAQYLRNFGSDGSPRVTGPELLTALSQTLASEFLAAREASLTASFAAEAAERALEEDRKALDRARQALAALTNEGETNVLTLTFDSAEAKDITLTLQNFTAQAGWAPVYDLRLSRGEPSQLIIDRGVTLWQASGEDWPGVDVTLSTARPSQQSRPSGIGPDLRSIVEEGKAYGSASYDRAGAAPPSLAAPSPAYEPAPVADFAGTNVTYHYPAPVDLRNSVDALRLELSSLSLTPEVLAAATPLYDTTAFVLALTRNSSPELLLPGAATLWFEGEMVGQTQLPLLAAGAETEIGFGPIDGLQLKRIMPERSEGRAGLIGRSYQQDEQLRIEVENLTAESWPVRLLDRVPFSEQDSLSISWSADPKPDVTDREGLRGILEWRFDLEPGQKRQIQLGWQLRWPSGYELQ